MRQAFFIFRGSGKLIKLIKKFRNCVRFFYFLIKQSSRWKYYILHDKRNWVFHKSASLLKKATVLKIRRRNKEGESTHWKTGILPFKSLSCQLPFQNITFSLHLCNFTSKHGKLSIIAASKKNHEKQQSFLWTMSARRVEKLEQDKTKPDTEHVVSQTKSKTN